MTGDTKSNSELAPKKRRGTPRGKRGAVAEREVRAWQLHVTGATYAQIASTPDPADPGHTLYGSESAAREAVERVRLILGPEEGVAEQRARVLAALQAQELNLNRIISNRNEPSEIRIFAMRELRQILKSERELGGLDMAQKFLHVVVPADEELERMRAGLMERAKSIRLLPAGELVDAEVIDESEAQEA